MILLSHDEPARFGTPSRLFGTGRGIDHLVIAVRNLEEATKEYGQRLGLDVSSGGRHQGGTENSVAWFSDTGYLELLGVYDSTKGGAWVNSIVKFLANNEGAIAVGLDVSSATQTMAFLRSAGHEAEGPKEGTITIPEIEETPPVLWRTVGVNSSEPILNDILFFIEYDKAAEVAMRAKYPQLPDRASRARHPNTARRMTSIWLATRDLKRATDEFLSIGLPVVRQLKLSKLNATASEIQAGTGTFLLMRSEDSDGPVAQFLDQRKSQDAVMGASLEVESIDAALASTRKGTSMEIQAYSSPFGQSLLIPPTLARGVWIEMFQQSPKA